MSDLLPCLKCGSKIIGLEFLHNSSGHPEPMRYTCKNGHAWDEWHDLEKEAAIAWNTRLEYKWKTCDEWEEQTTEWERDGREEAFSAAREMKEKGE